jgi:multicomponent K+:H+ antiporter subunit A
MKLPLEILAAHCLIVGLVPGLTVEPFLRAAATNVLGRDLPPIDLAIWHGFNLPLAMSLVALVGGIALYSQRRRVFALHDRFFPPMQARHLFSSLVEAFFARAGRLIQLMENGSLQRSVFLLLGSAALALVTPLVTGIAPLTGPLPPAPVDGLTLLGAAALMGSAMLTVRWHRQRLLALLPLSVVGLLSALAFARFSGPDLALTQLAIETVTIILFLLALFFLPQQGPRESTAPRRSRDLALALTLGTATGLLVWAMLTRSRETISGFFMANSLPGGGGANVVNVILVDFRGFDTLGEITVLAIAALAIHALLDGLCLPAGRGPDGLPRWDAERYPLILAQTTRFLLPLALLVSVFLFLRGHNAPGGGFIAGLVTAAALILQYMASGITWTREQWAMRYHRLIAWGLLFALTTGLGSWLFDRPFLTSAFGHFDLPLVGEFELASAMLFDLGVYLVVVGVLMLILATLGKLNQRCMDTMEAP